MTKLDLNANNLKMILEAIQSVENRQQQSDIQWAENLDSLYSCLKAQAECLIEAIENEKKAS